MKKSLLLSLVFSLVCTGMNAQNKVLNLDGTNGYISLPALNLAKDSCTIEAWVKPNGTQPSMAGIFFHRLSPNTSGLHFGTTGELRYTWNDASNTWNWNSGLKVYLNTWVHLAMVVTPLKTTLYVNGSKATNSVTCGASPFGGETRIGSDAQGGRNFKGSIDDVRIWKSARTGKQIMDNMYKFTDKGSASLLGYWNFDAGTAIDSTLHGFNGTIKTGASIVAEEIPVMSNSSLSLSEQATGTIPSPFSAAPKKFSIEWWIKPNNTQDYNQRIECNAANNWGTFTFHTTVGGGVYVGTDLNTRFTPTNIPDGTVQVGKWQHFAFTFDNGYANFYKNGNLICGKQSMTLPQSWGSIKLGLSNQNGYIDGVIDDIRIWSVARTADEIKNNRTTSYQPTEPNLVGLWNFNDKKTSIISDSASVAHNGTFTATAYYVPNDRASQSGVIDNPFPETNRTVSRKLKLSWDCILYDKFIVYMGTDSTSVLNAKLNSALNVATVTTTSYAPTNLANATKYFWRVDGVSGADTIKNTVYSFKTITQKLEDLQNQFLTWKYGMFLHFSIGTFSGEEWTQDPQNWPSNKFQPVGLNCGQWADAMKTAGMQYAVLTTKHHDGFCLWPSAYSSYGVKNSTWLAGKGDVVKMYTDSLRSRGLKVGLYFSIIDWSVSPTTTYVKNQLTELLDGRYGKIDILWTDGWGWNLGYNNINYQQIYAHIKSLQPDILLLENGKNRYYDNSDIVIFERNVDGIPNESFTFPFEICDNILPSKWFFPPTAGEACVMKSTTWFPTMLRGIKNRGNYLLDCTPDKSGLIPTCQVTKLKEIADSLVQCGWLEKPAGLINTNLKGSEKVAVYPNPTTGKITISTESDEFTYSVRTLNGQLIEEKNILASATSIFMPSTGVYLMQVKTPKRIFNQKIVVQ